MAVNRAHAPILGLLAALTVACSPARQATGAAPDPAPAARAGVGAGSGAAASASDAPVAASMLWRRAIAARDQGDFTHAAELFAELAVSYPREAVVQMELG